MTDPLRLAIVDDEFDNIRLIMRHLASYQSQISIVGKFTNPREALTNFSREKPDVILLDIEMPMMNGFELLNQLNEASTEVVFITGHDEYALQAIKCAAIDYILKPFSRDELHTALNKVKTKLRNGEERMKKISNTVQGIPDKRLVIPGTSAYLSITHQDILYLGAMRGGYTMFHMLDGRRSLATHPLNFYEELLGPHGFYRTHKSHLVNMHHVKAYEPNLLLTKMVDETELDLATRRRTGFLHAWREVREIEETQA